MKMRQRSALVVDYKYPHGKRTRIKYIIIIKQVHYVNQCYFGGLIINKFKA